MSKKNISICIVAGAGGLIGSRIAEDFSNTYDKVYSLDKKISDSSKTENIKNIEVDLTDEASVSKVFGSIFSSNSGSEQHTAISKLALINCQAISDPHSGPLAELKLDKWNEYLNINLTSYFLNCREALRHREKYKSLRIVNISSTRHLIAEPDTEAYGTTKGGVLSFTRSLAVSLRDTDSLVNCISPGWIDEENKEHSSENKSQHLSGRVGKPSDISNLCLHLCSHVGDFISGQDFVVDGGITAKMVYK